MKLVVAKQIKNQHKLITNLTISIINMSYELHSISDNILNKENAV